MLTGRYCEAPLKIAKTFREDKTNALLLVMMDVSPGLMDGDRYEANFKLGASTHLIVTNQSFTKVHPARRYGASTEFRFELSEGAMLEYMPEPTIPFAGSRLEAVNRFELSDGSVLLYADICAPGRTHRGELFQFDEYSALTEIYWNGELTVWDRFRLVPALDDFRAIGAMEHYTHHGTFWAIANHADETLLARIRAALPDDRQERLLAAASLAANRGIVVRMLGLSAWELQALCSDIREACRNHLFQSPL